MKRDIYTTTLDDAGAFERVHGPAYDDTDRPTLADELDDYPLGRRPLRPVAGPSPLCRATVHWDGTRACTCCPRGCGGHVTIDPFLSGHPAWCSAGCGWSTPATETPDPALPATIVVTDDPPF